MRRVNQVLTYFDRIQVYRTHADIGLSKRSKNNPSEKERFNIAKTGGPRMTGEKYRRAGEKYRLAVKTILYI